MWVADRFGGAIARVDAGNGEPRAEIPMDAEPVAMALVAGELWVAASAPQSAHRGGTLRFASEYPPDSIDPAAQFLGPSGQILSLTNDGLVAFDQVAGPQGAAIVPDLATSLPLLSANGKAYTFTLRPGIRYSNGTLVEPADFQRAIERVLLFATVGYYSGIVGAASCTTVASCRLLLSKGIIPNPATRTVTFNLTKPDPEFLYKLALSFADAVPANTPLKPIVTKPFIPATGPYKIASYKPGPHGSIVLVRNPRFVQWSQAAQPRATEIRSTASTTSCPPRRYGWSSKGQLDVTDDSPARTPTDSAQQEQSKSAARRGDSLVVRVCDERARVSLQQPPRPRGAQPCG